MTTHSCIDMQLNINIQFCTTSADLVRNIFLKQSFSTKSNELNCLLLIVHASRPYNSTGRHLTFNISSHLETTSKEVDSENVIRDYALMHIRLVDILNCRFVVTFSYVILVTLRTAWFQWFLKDDMYTVSQKLDPFLFEDNFGKYCPILIILSLLQTEINCDNVYHKIYHHTSNLLVRYLVKWTIGQRYWHDFVIKDETVKQIALNLTDMDKISIASSQAVLEMSSFSVNTRSMSSSPLVNSLVSLVKNRLFNIRRCMTA